MSFLSWCFFFVKIVRIQLVIYVFNQDNHKQIMENGEDSTGKLLKSSNFF